jgi:16S rRNA (guanine966-N2)-methyltransferase
LSRQKTNALRIIGGRWRSRVVHFPDVAGLRPTPDRVRETLFNWLGQRLDGWRCLDLFAGSGALGFEAASRGAAEVILVERDAKALAALRDNARKLEAADAVQVWPADARAYLNGACGQFDLIFLDPPFDAGLLPEMLVLAATRLSPGGKIYAESGSPSAVETVPGLTTLRRTRAGLSHSFLLERV